MRTFKGKASLDFRLVVPDQFVAQFRAAAQAPDAPLFFQQQQAKHPDNDDAFIEGIISNALRRVLRNRLLDEMAYVGIGGTVSPVKINVMAAPTQHEGEAVPQVHRVTRPDGCVDVESQDDVGGALAYIASNHVPADLSHGGID